MGATAAERLAGRDGEMRRGRPARDSRTHARRSSSEPVRNGSTTAVSRDGRNCAWLRPMPACGSWPFGSRFIPDRRCAARSSRCWPIRMPRCAPPRSWRSRCPATASRSSADEDLFRWLHDPDESVRKVCHDALVSRDRTEARDRARATIDQPGSARAAQAPSRSAVTEMSWPTRSRGWSGSAATSIRRSEPARRGWRWRSRADTPAELPRLGRSGGRYRSGPDRAPGGALFPEHSTSRRPRARFARPADPERRSDHRGRVNGHCFPAV